MTMNNYGNDDNEGNDDNDEEFYTNEYSQHTVKDTKCTCNEHKHFYRQIKIYLKLSPFHHWMP